MSFALSQLCLRCHAAARTVACTQRNSVLRAVVKPSLRLQQVQSSEFTTHPARQTRGSNRALGSAAQSAALEQPASAPLGTVTVETEPLEWDETAAEPTIELVLPPPTNTKVKTANFVKSSTAISQCPTAGYPEFAVIGRSNVGKSSLINMLTGRKALAQISKTPGKPCT